MLQVRDNEISLRKWSGGSAHLHTGNIGLHYKTSVYNQGSVATLLKERVL